MTVNDSEIIEKVWSERGSLNGFKWTDVSEGWTRTHKEFAKQCLEADRNELREKIEDIINTSATFEIAFDRIRKILGESKTK